MPFLINSAPATTRNANAILARSFFPRAKKLVYPLLSGSFVSKRYVEPFSIIGSVPLVKSFSNSAGGGIRLNAIASFKMTVPNLLFRMGFQLSQTDLEFDQTGALMQLSQAAGMRLADFPDQLFFKRLVTGSLTSSASVVFDYDGVSYPVTFDGQPFFSTAHPTGLNGTSQSNIITGALPLTAAAVAAQDIATTAQQLQADFTQAVTGFQTVTDTAGAPLYPNLDPSQSVVAVVPPCLREAATLAFATSGSVIAQTTNIYPKAVKQVISSGYLGKLGFPDPEDPTNTTNVKITNETDCFYFIVDDYIKPFYVQLFQPLPNSEILPLGWNAGEMVERLMAADKSITVDQATSFASTRIDTTFKNIGDNADTTTIMTDNFTVATRSRGNIVYGPHMTAQRVKPSGGN